MLAMFLLLQLRLLEAIMRIKTLLMACLIAQPVLAADGHENMSADMMKEHGGGIFHMFRLETDIGANNDGDTVASWDLDGWIGADENKLWLKSEGEHKDGKLEQAEVWALYSRNIATFWDAQA